MVRNVVVVVSICIAGCSAMHQTAVRPASAVHESRAINPPTAEELAQLEAAVDSVIAESDRLESALKELQAAGDRFLVQDLHGVRDPKRLEAQAGALLIYEQSLEQLEAGFDDLVNRANAHFEKRLGEIDQWTSLEVIDLDPELRARSNRLIDRYDELGGRINDIFGLTDLKILAVTVKVKSFRDRAAANRPRSL